MIVMSLFADAHRLHDCVQLHGMMLYDRAGFVYRYPLSAPNGHTLQSTKRVTRYWALHDQVAAATEAAARSGSAATAEEPHAAAASSHLPSLLEVQILSASLL